MMTEQKIKVAVAGLGAIGKVVAARVSNGDIPNCELVAVSARDKEKAKKFLNSINALDSVNVLALQELASVADIVVECAPSTVLEELLDSVFENKKKAIVLSVGALLEMPSLIQKINKGYSQVMVPTGALLGLDAVAAAAEGNISSVKMTSRKPPIGWEGAPYVIENNIDLSNVQDQPLNIFKGTAREAAAGFPANLNVCAALSLAGVGPDRTYIEVWADPGVTRNTHLIELVSDSAFLTMQIENIPSENPKTGRITAQSVLALLRKMTSSLQIGT